MNQLIKYNMIVMLIILDTYHCLGLAVAAADTSLAIAFSSSSAGAVPTFIFSASLDLLECESLALLFISSLFAHNMAYNPITISTPPIILLHANTNTNTDAVLLTSYE